MHFKSIPESLVKNNSLFKNSPNHNSPIVAVVFCIHSDENQLGFHMRHSSFRILKQRSTKTFIPAVYGM